jgi:hypothetical protein
MKNQPTSRAKLILTSILAASVGLPMPFSQTDSRAQRATARTQQQFRASESNEKSAPLAPAQATAPIAGLIRGLDGMAPTALFGRSGRSPKDWGMSRECAQMVRKNKMRRMGISAQRI